MMSTREAVLTLYDAKDNFGPKIQEAIDKIVDTYDLITDVRYHDVCGTKWINLELLNSSITCDFETRNNEQKITVMSVDDEEVWQE